MSFDSLTGKSVKLPCVHPLNWVADFGVVVWNWTLNNFGIVCMTLNPGYLIVNFHKFPHSSMQVMPPKITKQDFDRVLARARPTVGKEDLKVYTNFTEEFGEDGWMHEDSTRSLDTFVVGAKLCYELRGNSMTIVCPSFRIVFDKITIWNAVWIWLWSFWVRFLRYFCVTFQDGLKNVLCTKP